MLEIEDLTARTCEVLNAVPFNRIIDLTACPKNDP
jgi:hypothetical protein